MHPQKDKIIFKIIYWNDLVEKLKETIDQNDKNNGLLLNELINHLDDKFGFNNIKFTNNQIELMQNTLIPSTILNLNKVIVSLANSFDKVKWDNRIEGGYGEGYGFWYKDSIWIGYWFELWMNKNAPLILFINKKMDKEKIINQELYEYFDIFFAGRGVQTYNLTDKFINLSEIITDTKNVEIINRLIVDFLDKVAILKDENRIP